MDLETEKNWFVESSWEHQKTAEVVIITPKVQSPAVVKVTIEYLKSIGIKIDDSFPSTSKTPSIIVNLVNKEMVLTQRGFSSFTDNKTSFQAYPSQVLEFLEQNKGRLTGKKFGL
jgi:predicted lactoylglutathione lyase